MRTTAACTLEPRRIADIAVQALHDEIDLTPKPGLVDRRGPGAHTDMTREMLHTSADSLRAAFFQCASVAAESEPGTTLRARIGLIGRTGEQTMLTATGGVNTHRGALWAVGLLCAAAGAGAATVEQAAAFAGGLARIPDPAAPPLPAAVMSHGARARRRYGVAGAPGEAQAGFPHVTGLALPALRAGLAGSDPTAARLDALLTLIAHLDDTCLLHRGGTGGLVAVQSAARATVVAGGMRTPEGRRCFSVLDRLCADRRLSPGGAGDLLAATLFLDSLDLETGHRCKP
ncbi:triphosphoribosyl-dephospho-CoA synthase MdcB [Mycolicibacterium sp. CH28]|uniref:triphosphoribosyl-dephospho-CoA synthase MdcB n=1 Tax=Mycolicibacterium sp. CH28 TaxID=2512237 RepID=UPI001913C35F|nr:triphosphoribosyl-dephospho-CoA synthase MdcB [Mycolicibacterium sp. CH28]